MADCLVKELTAFPAFNHFTAEDKFDYTKKTSKS